MNETLSKYKTSTKGLSEKEVKSRQKKYGLNQLDEKKPKTAIRLFLEQFIDALIALLIIAAIAAYAIGDIIDAAVIILAVLLNTIIGFIQEYRSQKAVETLKNLITKKAVVRRDNEIRTINSRELTLGDIVIVKEGGKVPADLKLIECNNLEVNESMITGESEGITKNIDDELYMDSSILSGNGIGVVTAVGMNTTIGKIAEIVQEESGETPLQKKVDKLGKTLSIIAIIVCIVIFVIELTKGIPLVETFMTSVSLAVAAIPEGLPAVLTLTLALGMQNMAKSDTIVKRLLSVETLGSCNVICSDKTGTLTENKMTVTKSFYLNEEKTSLIGTLCNDAIIKENEEIGNPTDIAILKHFNKNTNEIEGYERVNEIPLDRTRKIMTTEYIYNNENTIILSKGAPEIILDKTKYVDNNGTIEIITPEIKETIMDKIDEMTGEALRVIAYGYTTENKSEENLIFTGLTGIIDPPKKSAKKAVKDCENAGIKVIMITGDHKKTATAIAKDLNILKNGKVITGEELDSLSDEEYEKIAEDIEVYARVKPTQKMRIVETLKKKENIVAMTGDGVNDAPALKKASIGVAMGNGTDVAHEAADMILQNNDFTSIITSIKEGRKIYDNIKRFVKFQVSTNVGAILTIIGTTILSLPLPFNPAQLLWINIVMDGPPAQTLGMESAEKNIMKRPPENGDILNRNTLAKILISGIVMAIGTILLFKWQLSIANEKKAMTMAFTVFVVYQLFNAYNCKADSEKSSKYLYMGIIISFILQLLIIYTPLLETVFKTQAIGLTDWVIIILISSTIILSEKLLNKVIK